MLGLPIEIKKTKQFNNVKAVLLFMTLIFVGFNAQAQILTPTYPSPAEDVVRGLNQTQLSVQVLFSNACNDDTILIVFPTSVSYVPGSIQKTQGTQTISEADISDLNKPTFKVSNVPSGGGSIEFSLLRKASCGVLSSGKDEIYVKGSCGTVKEDVAGVNSYGLLGASLSLLPPPAQSGAVIGSEYTREIKITNGGNGEVDTLNYYVIHENVSILKAQDSILINGIYFEPTSQSGDTLFYKLHGKTLFNGDSLLANGETVSIIERVIVDQCNANSTYIADWGDKSKTVCQTAFGTSTIAVAGGVPSLTAVTRKEINYVDKCTPYDIEFSATNGGTGNDTAAGMYDIDIQHGYVYPRRSYVQAYDTNIVCYSNARINGQSVSTFTSAGNIVRMNLKDLFTSDPDGAGVGLEDLDGDGYYDDLPRGNTVTYTLNLKWKCNTTCGYNKILYTGARIYFETMCGDASSSNPVYSYRPIYESSFTGTAYVPANIMGGVPFRIKFKEGHYINSYSNDNANTRYEWKLILPSGFSVSGSGNPTYGVNSSSYTQVGDTIYIVSDTNKLFDAEIDLVLNCGVGGGVRFNYELNKIDNNLTNCKCQSRLVCSSVYSAAFCPGPCQGPSNFIPIVE